MGRKTKSKEELEELFSFREMRNIGKIIELREEGKTEFDKSIYGNEKNNSKSLILSTLEFHDDENPLIEKIKLLSISECNRLVELAKLYDFEDINVFNES